MTNPQIEQRMAANAARHNKMLDPWETRKGQIKLGKMYHRCYTCNVDHLAIVPECPKCHGKNWGKDKPKGTDRFIFYGDAGADGISEGHKEFGNMVTEIPVTLKDVPYKCAVIQYECWRMDKIYCSSRWIPDGTGKYDYTGKAHRRDFGEVPCNPLTCPLHNGGQIQDFDGKTLTINPEQPWCKQKVTLSMLIPALPGLDSYTIKSGGMKSIMNVMWAVRNLTILTEMTGVTSLMYVLRMVPDQSTYKLNGQWKTAKYKTFVLEFPFSLEKLIIKAKRGNLELSEIAYVLPCNLQSVSKSLPAPNEGGYDPLVDPPAIEPKEKSPADASTNIDDLNTSREAARSVDSKPTADQMRKIKGCFIVIKKYSTDEEYERVKKLLCESFGITRTSRGGLEFSKCLDPSSADKVIQWLSNKIESDMSKPDETDDY